MTPLKFRVYDLTTAKMEYEGDDLALIGDSYQNVAINGLDGDLQYEIVQSTGLTDKNGVEIFEGDILEGDAFGVVVFSQGRFTGCYVCQNGDTWDYSDNWEDELHRMKVKVIGNIYQNPDLLPPRP